MEQVQEKISITKLLTRKGVVQLHLLLSISLLLTHGIDKTYVFLICNGILVVLVKTSSSLVSQSTFDLKEHVYIKTIHEALHTQYEDGLVEDAELEIKVVHGDEDDMKVVMENFGETAEESNKRFDEFIRKRKEELKSDSQLLMLPCD
ncbi:hypothetical protein CTI12_AA559990 [Artemisia annua]|uniref:Uncharacterized protein n=1 Tax=Artemisia annua TaxID=35608 RepID=A0A2U1KVJ9_ARTAN|nr:hypothetical protein CTI12_AA559990 [Artemisia annua]